MNHSSDIPFWRQKKLQDMSHAEWESLCDGCGKCCLHKIEEEEEDGSVGAVHVTNVACRLLDLKTAQCQRYDSRKRFVANCAVLTLARLDQFHWLPDSCAYRLIGEGKDLFDWHPLISGDKSSVIKAGISVVGRVVDEREAGDFEDHIVTWPVTDTPAQKPPSKADQG